MSSSSETANLNWRQSASYRALRGIMFALRALSVRQCARFGATLGGLAFRCMKSRRRSVIHNLRIVYAGTKSYGECEAIGREVFRRTGANIIGGLRGGLLPDDRRHEVVEVRGQENMRVALAEKRGVITLVGHMGPWEILAQIGDLLFLGAPYGSLYRPIDNVAVDTLVRVEREKRGARLFSRKDGWIGPVGLLREGGALGVLADQRVGAAGVPAPFFGREVLSSRLPYVLHRKTKAPLITMSAWTREPGKWVVQIHPPIFPERENFATREAFTARCNQALEAALRVSVEDVFWFHRRFRAEVKRFFPGVVEGSEAVPVRRALVVLPDDPAAAVACVRGIVAFARERPGLAFVVAGEHARTVVEETEGAEAFDSLDVVEGSAPTGPRKLVRRILEVDRAGPVGIDGALIFSAARLSFWCSTLETAGIDRILALSGQQAPRGVRLPFAPPDRPEDPDAWVTVLESVSAPAPTEAR